MEGFGRILALPADHPQATDYINNIRPILSCEAPLNRLQMSAELQNCKKVVTTPGTQKEKPPHPRTWRRRPRFTGRDLLDHFFFDDDLHVRGHILMQLHRNIELAHCLQGFVQLNLPAVNMKAFLLKCLRNVAGGH